VRTKPEACTKCGARFAHKSNLRVHRKKCVDGVLTPFACDQCQKKFAHPTTLADHKAWVHEGRKPHSCPVCGLGCSARSNLARHMKRKHGWDDTARGRP
jgi:uncharacterized Zn-finger protein